MDLAVKRWPVSLFSRLSILVGVTGLLEDVVPVPGFSRREG
jgi:hypothetical protein